MTDFDRADVERNRVAGGLGYLIFFIPLLACPNSRYGRYCANQGLIFWLIWFALGVVFGLLGLLVGWVPLIGSLIAVLKRLAQIGLIVLEGYYTYLAVVRGDARKIPYVGRYQLIR